MKKIVLFTFLLFALNPLARATSHNLEAVECKRELVSEGLSVIVKETILEYILGGSFEVADFSVSEWDTEEYIVKVIHKMQSDNSTMEMNAVVKVIDAKTCEVTGHLWL